MYAALYRLGVGAYLLWILLVVVHMIGRFTPAPSFRIVRLGVVVGAAKLLRNGYERAASRLDERS